MELSVQTKTYLVLGIMIGCFAILYPKIFHPMLMACLGMRQSSSSSASASGDFSDGGGHPRLRRPSPMMGGGGGGPSGPGPRMSEQAAQAQARQQQGGGGRGNVVGLILPVYAIGIVLYLVYTLVKVMGGFKANNNNNNSQTGNGRRRDGDALNDYYKNFHFDPLSGEFVDNGGSGGSGGGAGRRGDVDDDDNFGMSEQNRYERMHRDLEKLLKRVDDQDISENELVQLRSRLQETEKQMSSILGAMHCLQQRQQQPQVASEESPGGSVDGAALAADGAAPAAASAEAEMRHRKPFSLPDADQ